MVRSQMVNGLWSKRGDRIPKSALSYVDVEHGQPVVLWKVLPSATDEVVDCEDLAFHGQ